MSDITKLLSGDSIFIQSLIKKVFPSIKQYVMNNSGTIEDAKDLTQESLYITIDKLRSGAYKENTNLVGYCITIAQNEWRNSLRKKSVRNKYKEKLEAEIKIIEQIEDTKENSTKVELINKHLKNLSEQCQELIRLHYFLKVKLIDVSSILGYTENFIKVKHKRCLEQFRNYINSNNSVKP